MACASVLLAWGIWTLGQEEGPQQRSPLRGRVTSNAFCWDGPRLLSVIGSVIGKVAILRDVETGRELQRFQGHQEVIRAVTISPDGKQVLPLSATV